MSVENNDNVGSIDDLVEEANSLGNPDITSEVIPPVDAAAAEAEFVPEPEVPLTNIQKARLALQHKIATDPNYKHGGPKLTKDQYKEAKELRQIEGWTLKQLGEKFGVSPMGLLKRFKRDGVVKGELAEAQKKALQDRITEGQAARIDTIVNVYLANEEITVKGIAMINRHVLKLFADTQQKNRPQAAILQDYKACAEALKAIKLGSDTVQNIVMPYRDKKETDLPELPIRVMDEEDVKRIRHQEDLESAMMGMTPGDMLDGGEEEQEVDEGDDSVVEES